MTTRVTRHDCRHRSKCLAALLAAHGHLYGKDGCTVGGHFSPEIFGPVSYLDCSDCEQYRPDPYHLRDEEGMAQVVAALSLAAAVLDGDDRIRRRPKRRTCIQCDRVITDMHRSTYCSISCYRECRIAKRAAAREEQKRRAKERACPDSCGC